MAEYEKLIKSLRICAKAERDYECAGCAYTGYNCNDLLKLDAATAIKELVAQVKDKDYLIQQQEEEIQRLWRDVKKQQEKMICLAGKLPKKGKWSHVNRVDRSWETDEIFGFIVQCSVCGNKTIGASLYCPGCGAKMEV